MEQRLNTQRPVHDLENNVGRQASGLTDIMRDENTLDVLLSGLLDELLDYQDRCWVKARGRLIKQQKIRLVSNARASASRCCSLPESCVAGCSCFSSN